MTAERETSPSLVCGFCWSSVSRTDAERGQRCPRCGAPPTALREPGAPARAAATTGPQATTSLPSQRHDSQERTPSLSVSHRLTEQERTRYGETIDLAATLTLDRVVEHALGSGACARNPRDNEAAAPWLPAPQYGHRVHVTLELLRLLPAG
ncbi:MAG: hypothetical protein M0Z40_12105 [Actinomycetota bacterium]|jgi:hypothetical protein|nr:hypothetical protein [Actinomycetota bacterium]MDA8075950.1 hypothetical protein [Actinomycetota bacterium]